MQWIANLVGRSESKVRAARRARSRMPVVGALAQIEALEDRTLLAAPTLAAIPNQTVLSGSPLYIPLNALDSDGQPLTFTASSNNPELQTYIPEGNRSLRIEMYGGGTMTFELFEDLVPRATSWIIQLAEDDFYNGSTFHRIDDEFMIQGGRASDGSPGSGLGYFKDQFHFDLQHNRTGLISMAKTYDDTNDSQFFITEGPQRHLDFQHTIFGMMTKGEAVRDAISNLPVIDDVPLEAPVMTNVEVFVDHQNGVLRLKAPEGASGAANVTVQVSDPDGNVATRTFQVHFTPDTVNSDPFLEDVPVIETSLNEEVRFHLQARDVEGNTEGGVDLIYLDQWTLHEVGLEIPLIADPNLVYSVDPQSGEVVVTPKNGISGTYYFTVAVGERPQAIDYEFVRIDISPLERPILRGPLEPTVDTTPTFSWLSVEGAVSYEIWVNDQTTGESGIILESGLTTPRYTPTTPLTVGHSYIWTVRAIGEDGLLGHWSPHETFTVTELANVAPPTLVPVVSNALDATPTFKWSAVEGAARYDIWVNDMTTGLSGIIRNQHVSTNSFTPPADLPGGHHYVWTVRAIGENGVGGQWATHNYFKIADAPKPLSLTRPTDIVNPTFSWTEVPGAVVYDLWVNNLTTGESGVIREKTLSTNSYTPPPGTLPAGHRYVWTVRAADVTGQFGSWATHAYFSIAPDLTSPLTVTFDTTPTFTWSEVEGAVSYALWVNDINTGQSGIILENPETNSYTPTVPLTVGHSYIWTVRSFDAGGNGGTWAKHKTFKVVDPQDVAPPAITGGTGTTIDATPTFSWSPVPGAAHYDLWVNDLTTGQSAVVRQKTLTTNSYTATNLVVGHSYLWTVVAIAEDGTLGQWAPHKSLKIVAPQSVPAPTPASPPPVTIDATPTFSWSPVPGAAHYDLWANDLTTGQVAVVRQKTLTTNSYTAHNLVPGHAYIWTVQAINDSGVGGQWSKHQTFKIAVPDTIAAPTLTDPPPVTIDATPTFEWSPVPGAARYDLWVNDLTTGQSGVIRQKALTDTSFTATSLVVGHTYIWTVQAINDSGVGGKWGTHKTFKITAPDTLAPQLLKPDPVTLDATPTFEWSPIPGAARYDLWVNDLTTGQSAVIREKNLTDNKFTPTIPLKDGHQYLWTVQAVNDDGTGGAWGTHRSFRVDLSTAPTPVAPINWNKSAPAFQWTAVAGAVYYDLWVNDLTTGQMAVVRQTRLTTNSYTATNLVAGHNYVWTVRALAADGSGAAWAKHAYFQVAALDTSATQLEDETGTSPSDALDAAETDEHLAPVPVLLAEEHDDADGTDIDKAMAELLASGELIAA